MITYQDFEKLDIRTGTIIQAKPSEKARKPAYQLLIDFGQLGIKKSSAQLTVLYKPDTLIGKQVIAIVNLPPLQIADFISECLVLGAVDTGNEVTLLVTDNRVQNGLKIA
jgi:tRNA-binding protein